jgi:SAM-dependent methyltransferase
VIDRSTEAGPTVAAALFAAVEPLLVGRSLAIEVGCGAGEVLLDHAAWFDELRGVDAEPERLAQLTDRAAAMGLERVRGFLPTENWHWPTGSADYVYSRQLFQQLEDRIEAADYLQGVGGVLRPGGIAQVAFDTRPEDVGMLAGLRLPWRRAQSEPTGTPSVRRKADWVRDRFRGADMLVIDERQPGTAEHWFVARRR